MVCEQTSYVPSETTHRFIIPESLILGFQSSKVVSKSSANLKQSPWNFPFDTSEPELHASLKNEKMVVGKLSNILNELYFCIYIFNLLPEIIVFSKVITTAPFGSKS